MLTVYIICFWVGLLLTLITAFLGGDFGHGIDFGGHSADAGFHFPLNLTSLLAFLTVFGGVGYLLSHMGMVGGIGILLIAVAAGVGIAWVLFLFLSKVLMRTEDVMQESNYSLQGTLGTVSMPIPVNGTGEMKYVLNGTTRSMGIREEKGRPLDRGTKVIVLKMMKGIGVVSVFDDPLNGTFEE